MKIFKYIYSLVILLAVGACTSDNEIFLNPDNSSSDNGLEIECSVIIPGLSTASTRGVMGDYPTDGNLKLTLLEFTVGDNGYNSLRTDVYQAVCTSTTAVANGGKVTFKVTLNGTTDARKLHLIVADDYVTPPDDAVTEAAVLTSSSLTVTNSREAYWGEVILEDGYLSITDNEDGTTSITPRTDYIKQKLTDVPVIRNFAKVTVTENVSNFDLLGFVIVNKPTRGSMVPWDASTLSTPDLLSGSDMKAFSSLSYGGILPANTGFDNQETDDTFKASTALNANGTVAWPTSYDYMYEHPYESSRHTYLVLYGNFRASSTSAWVPYYYKVDFGSQVATGFDYYNIIRNYNYIVTITDVNAPGYETLSEAMSKRVYNNITADVKMQSISDGNNMLTVSSTKHVFIQNGTTAADDFTFEAIYISDVTGSKTLASDKLYISGLEVGTVIASVDSTISAVKKVFTITPQVLGTNESQREQTFTVFDGEGLGRDISLILTRPYKLTNVFVRNDSIYTTTETVSEAISTNAGAPFTLFFNMPAGMPEEIFPLTFQVESQNQIMENLAGGGMTVTTGPSLFDPNVTAISYVKDISYSEYQYAYNSNNDGINISVTDTSHLIRCRLSTITSGTANDSIIVHNEYFDDAKIEITRSASAN